MDFSFHVCSSNIFGIVGFLFYVIGELVFQLAIIFALLLRILWILLDIGLVY